MNKTNDREKRSWVACREQAQLAYQDLDRIYTELSRFSSPAIPPTEYTDSEMLEVMVYAARAATRLHDYFDLDLVPIPIEESK